MARKRTSAPPVWRHYLMLLLFAGSAVAVAGRVVVLGVSEREFLTAQGDARSVRIECPLIAA